MLSKGKIDENKALVQESDDASVLKEFYVANPELNVKYTPSGRVPAIPEGAFRKLGRIVADHIGGSENVFVLDAAVGSHRLGEVNVRVITNSGNVNLFLKHLLPRQGHASSPLTFPTQYTVYIAPDLKLKDTEAEAMGISKSTAAATSSAKKSSSQHAFSVTNLDRSITLIAGTNSNQAIKEAIVAAISSRILQDTIPSLGLMNASLFQIAPETTGAASKSALVFDPSHLLTQLDIVAAKEASPVAAKETTSSGAKKAGNANSSKIQNANAEASPAKPSSPLFTAKLQDGVVGLDGVIWNHYGLYRMFQGITHSNDKVPRQRADIVEHVSGAGASSTVRITQSLKELPNEVISPSAVVFLIKDANSLLPTLSKLSLVQASKFLSVGYTGKEKMGAEGDLSKSLSPFFHPRSIVSQPGQLESLFQELASVSGAAFYVLNTMGKEGKEMSSSDVLSILSAASNGSLEKAKTTSDPVFKFQTIGTVPGVKGAMETSVSSSSAASKLASFLSL
jgi:ATP-dependent phosphoenolpyruvate carboxykinase